MTCFVQRTEEITVKRPIYLGFCFKMPLDLKREKKKEKRHLNFKDCDTYASSSQLGKIVTYETRFTLCKINGASSIKIINFEVLALLLLLFLLLFWVLLLLLFSSTRWQLSIQPQNTHENRFVKSI